MNAKHFICCFLTAWYSCLLPAQSWRSFTSPNGHIHFNFVLTDSVPMYSVAYDQQTLLAPSSLTLHFAGTGVFGRQLKLGKVEQKQLVDDDTLLVGKTSRIHEMYKEVTLPLQERYAPHRLVELQVRLFDDGLAFRYRFPKQNGWTSYELMEEATHIRPAGNPTVHARFLPGFTTSHEARETISRFDELKQNSLMDMPLLLEYSSGIYMGISEAALLDYAGMYLVKQGKEFSSRLSPLPGNEAIKVQASLPHQSPWRVLLISQRIGALIESNIISSLNAPAKPEEFGWIQPGSSDFHWWNGDILPDTTFPPQEDFLFNKYYIDFCARHHITYHTVIGYGGYPWYKSDAEGYGVAGKLTDVTKTIPTLDMQQICDYAKTKGVGIRVWVHWQAIYPALEKSFAQFERWGIKGMMVDFMDRDDQQMVNIQTEILQTAARHHLHIQFHGAYKPTGLQRTYPNEFTREGTLNYENDKWGNLITPDDDISIPFTRMLAGATDYHLGGFRAVPIDDYKIQYTRPLVVGTRCHMLAMYIVLESYLQMVCDYPDAYEGQAGFELLQSLPTVWDETKVLQAELNKYIVIARRKGKDWYVGAITNHEARDIDLPLNFLSPGAFTATSFTDAADADRQPNHLDLYRRTVTAPESIKFKVAGGGGAVFHFQKQ